MTKDEDGLKRRARQIQKSPVGKANGWSYTYCRRIALAEKNIENEWRQKFRDAGYNEEQIAVGIQKYRQENRERYEQT